MRLKFGQIQPLVSMVTDRVMMKKRCLHFFLAVFHPFLFILAGNDDMHESLDEFEFRPDWTTDCGVIIIIIIIIMTLFKEEAQLDKSNLP